MTLGESPYPQAISNLKNLNKALEDTNGNLQTGIDYLKAEPTPEKIYKLTSRLLSISWNTGENNGINLPEQVKLIAGTLNDIKEKNNKLLATLD